MPKGAVGILEKLIMINLRITFLNLFLAREINYFSNFSEMINFESSDFTQPVVDYLQNSYPNLNCGLVDLTNKNHLKNLTQRCNLVVAF